MSLALPLSFITVIITTVATTAAAAAAVILGVSVFLLRSMLVRGRAGELCFQGVEDYEGLLAGGYVAYCEGNSWP